MNCIYIQTNRPTFLKSKIYNEKYMRFKKITILTVCALIAIFAYESNQLQHFSAFVCGAYIYESLKDLILGTNFKP